MHKLIKLCLGLLNNPVTYVMIDSCEIEDSELSNIIDLVSEQPLIHDMAFINLTCG